ncbi:hypothetical protein BX589_10137 [Paraburkholderia fungorum]|jgi:hypothetical protein|nr:hypothetical protein BX589_10137 [Paraburkholderia fungorum]
MSGARAPTRGQRNGRINLLAGYPALSNRLRYPTKAGPSESFR